VNHNAPTGQFPPAGFPPPPPLPPQHATPKKPKKWGWILGIIAAFLIGYATGHAGDSTTTASPAAPTYNVPPPTYAQPTYEAPAAPAPQPSTPEATGPVPVGTPVNVDGDGLIVTVTEVMTRKSIGQAMGCINVTYENQGSDRAHRNMFDWTVRDKNGASQGPGLYGGNDALEAGDITPGGKGAGVVCFDLPRTEIAAVEYQGSLFSSGPDAEWTVQ